MSTHMLIAAAYVDLDRAKPLDPAAKLVLMAFADSADETSQESAPGLGKLRAWCGRSKPRTLAITQELVVEGLLLKIGEARLGRRAVYLVFPDGVPAIPHPHEVAQRYPTRSSPPVDNPDAGGSHPRDPRVSSGDARVSPTRPLQALPTGISTPTAPKRPARRVDKSTRGRFPGQLPKPRTIAAARCPEHPDQPLDCRECQLLRATPEASREAAAQIRLMMERQRQQPRPEEPAP